MSDERDAGSRRPGAPSAPSSVDAPAATGTLRARLEQDRLRLRAARLGRVLAALRARTRASDATPDALRLALADFQAQLESTRARMDSDGSSGSQRPSLSDPGGGGHPGQAVPEIAVADLRQRGHDVRHPAPVTRRTTRTPATPRR